MDRSPAAALCALWTLFVLSACEIEFDKKAGSVIDSGSPLDAAVDAASGLRSDASSAQGDADASDGSIACTPDSQGACCPAGFTGPECKTNIDECADGPCKNGGECEDLIDGFTCQCPAEHWEGATCEVDVNECADTSLCGQIAGFGACINTEGAYECVCAPGRTGAACEITEQCAVANVCTQAYPCVEESAPKTYRCAGQYPEWSLSEPTNRFSLSDGEVSDAKTALRWEQTVAESAYTWSDAKQHCLDLGNGFRMPSINELLSILDLTGTDTPIDTTVFPETPPAMFWSDSRYAGNSSRAWGVYFSTGSAGPELIDSVGRVRCVR